MLNQETKKRIFDARDILVGKIPDPKAQVEQITTALIYKFMDDMDRESEELGGEPQFFTGKYAKYAWSKLVDPRLSGHDRIKLYDEALETMPQNLELPQLFRNILNGAFLPYRDPETLRLFLKTINEFTYDHSEKLGDAFEYLLSILGSQGDAGQFRTPRHIIDFIVAVLNPQKNETILDPACGTAGFLISSYKHILQQNGINTPGDQLTPEDKTKLMSRFAGYDISPDMVRLSLVNMYLHGFPNPTIHEYDTLTSEERWDETADVIMANPPFMSPKGGIRPHKRFSVQAKRSEILFVDYIAEHLNPDGRAGIIVPEGIIFQADTAYKDLRKMLVEKYIYAVVSLPAGVFNPYSGVKTSILLMDKSLAKRTKDILFVKIEHDGFDLGAQRREIDKNSLPFALFVLQRYRQALRDNEDFALNFEDSDISKMFVLAAKSKIAKTGNYNLSGERYRKADKSRKQNSPLIELKDIFERVSKVINPALNEGEVTYIGLENIVSHTGELSGSLVTDLSEIKSLKNEFQRDDILYGKLRPNLNKVWLANTDGICSTDILVLRAKSSDILSKFYVHVLRSSHFNNEVLKGLNGAQLPRVNFDYLGDLKLPLLSPETQRELADELEGYQKVIDGAKQVVANYKPTIKPEPKWELVELEKLIEFVSGLTLSIPDSEDEKGVPIISINNVTEDGRITFDGLRKIKLPEQKTINYLQKEDLLFNWRNGSKHLVGKTAYFDLEGVYVFASFLIGIRTNTEKLLPKYLWYILNAYRREGKYMQFMRQNVNGLFNREELKLVKIPLPPLEIQEQIVAQLEEEQSLINANKRLINLFEQKIKDKINEVWGYGDPTEESQVEVEEDDVEEPEEPVKVAVPQIAQATLFTSF